MLTFMDVVDFGELLATIPISIYGGSMTDLIMRFDPFQNERRNISLAAAVICLTVMRLPIGIDGISMDYWESREGVPLWTPIFTSCPT